MAFADDIRGGGADRPPPTPPTQPGVRKKRSPLLITSIVLLAIALSASTVAKFWTEVLWFNQLGFVGVFRTRLLAQIAMFAIVALLMATAVAVSAWWAYKRRPIYIESVQPTSLDRYRAGIDPVRKLMMIGAAIVFGGLAGTTASAQWSTVLLFLNKSTFGFTDPVFNKDASFYVFTLPMIQLTIGLLSGIATVALLVSAVTHYLYGGIRVQANGMPFVSVSARKQIAILAAVWLLIRGASLWFDRYSKLAEESPLFTGAGYTAANAQIPANAIMAVVSVVVAALFVAAVFRGGWRLPLTAVALMVLASIALGGLYPWAIQSFKVKPSEQTLEAEYLKHHINATQFAYGIDDVEIRQYDGTTTAEPGALAAETETTASIRLIDPALVSPAFNQLQRNKQYYQFANPLDVDRYTIDGKSVDTVAAVRELDLNSLPASQRTWVNEHTVFTHGFGMVGAYGTRAVNGGQPDFFASEIPPAGKITEYEPRVYFGERSPQFSIVGGPEGSSPRELDYPATGGDEDKNFNTTFKGDGGPKIGSPINRLMYAIAFADQNILFTDAVNSESQVLYNRSPRERVKKVAPWLTLDGDPYPSVVNGRIVWILDGYTVSDKFPYSTTRQLDAVTTDQLTVESQSVAALQQRKVNYIRNSVKATVDAYDGKVKLYAWDENDPLLKSWSKVFPGTVSPMSEISADLMSHFRYPEDLFKVQRAVLGKYHIDDPQTFYEGSDFWKVPPEPTASVRSGDTPAPGQGASDQPPYYLTLKMPGQDEAAFSLTSTYIPATREGKDTNNLMAFLAVDANAGGEAGSRRDGYGKLRLLRVPGGQTLAGPGQVQNDFNSDPVAQRELSLLERGSSVVKRGNLLTLPVADGFLYVQPVYVESTTGTSFPLLRKVLVAFGDKIGFADSLDQALDQVFGGSSGATTDETPGGTTGQPSTPAPADPGTAPTAPGAPPVAASGSAQERLNDALKRANDSLRASQERLREGDFAGYGTEQQKLQQALEDAIKAEDDIRGATNGGSADSPGGAGSEDAAAEGGQPATEPTPQPTGETGNEPAPEGGN